MPTVRGLIPFPGMNDERDYAAKRLMAFLQLVGPVEAAWAMRTALDALEAMPAGKDHLAVVELALAELTATPEPVADAAGDSTPPSTAPITSRKRGKAS